MGRAGVLATVLAFGCGPGGTRAAPPPEPRPVPPSAAAPDAMPVPVVTVDAGAPPPVTLEAWARTLVVGAAPVPDDDIPAAAKDALLALAAPSLDPLGGERE